MDLPRLIAATMAATLIGLTAREVHLARHAAESRAQYYQRREMALGVPPPTFFLVCRSRAASYVRALDSEHVV